MKAFDICGRTLILSHMHKTHTHQTHPVQQPIVNKWFINYIIQQFIRYFVNWIMRLSNHCFEYSRRRIHRHQPHPPTSMLYHYAIPFQASVVQCCKFSLMKFHVEWRERVRGFASQRHVCHSKRNSNWLKCSPWARMSAYKHVCCTVWSHTSRNPNFQRYRSYFIFIWLFSRREKFKSFRWNSRSALIL